MNADTTKRPSRRYFVAIAAALTIAVLAGLAGVYGIGTLPRNGDPVCDAAVAAAKKAAPFARGEVAAVNVAAKPLKIPNLAFRDAMGKEHMLADWRGRTVLINLWATWCVPCRKEMPSLDALQARLGGDKFEVVAINIDTRNLDKPKEWLKEVGVSKLGYYADASAAVFQDLKAIGRAFGMPTTVLVDPQGCEIATLAGPAEWASDDALKLIEAAMAGSKSGS